MILVRRTAATEVSVSSASASDIWIAAESGTNNWTVAGFRAVVHDLCMLVGAVGSVAHITLGYGQNHPWLRTLDEGLERCHTNVRQNFIITRDGVKLYIADRTLETTSNSKSELRFSLRSN